METHGVGIVGWGVVGSGAVEILERERELLAGRCGIDFRLKAIVDVDLDTERPVRPGPDTVIADDLTAILGDGSIDTVLHLVGGTTYARDIALACLQAGKHVVTSNKALVAEHGDELFAAARDHQAVIAYEAAVAGGIPVIAALREGLVANRIQALHAILNGTCNFILTQMEERGMGFDDAVKLAQELGYAEADPSLDVDGVDTAHKLAILARIAFGRSVAFGDISVEGIRGITAADIASAKRLGCRIKLLAVAVPREADFELRVAPCLVPLDHPVAGVSANYNAVLADAHAAGPTLLVGQGAGSLPTASAVIADLVDIATGGYAEVAKRFSFFQPAERLAVCAENEEVTGSYARFTVKDEPGVLAKITGMLSDHGISILSVHQESPEDADHAVVEVTTHRARGANFFAAIHEIDGSGITTAETSTLRTLAMN